MNKLLAVTLSLFVLITSCSSQKKSSTKDTSTQYIKDSIEFYETDYEIRQKSFMKEMVGTWNINVMKRQSQMEPEDLSNVFITINPDSTFNGKAACNNISGKYSLKGTSIKFGPIISTKMACDKLDQEIAMLRLLEETVSAFTVKSNTLLLRDGASNIVFEGSRKN